MQYTLAFTPLSHDISLFRVPPLIFVLSILVISNIANELTSLHAGHRAVWFRFLVSELNIIKNFLCKVSSQMCLIGECGGRQVAATWACPQSHHQPGREKFEKLML